MVQGRLVGGLPNKIKGKYSLNAGLHFFKSLNPCSAGLLRAFAMPRCPVSSKMEMQCIVFVKLRTTEPFCFRCDGHLLFFLAQHPYPLSATDFCFHSGLKGLNLNLCHFPHQKSKQVIQGWPIRVLPGKSCWPTCEEVLFYRGYRFDRIS